MYDKGASKELGVTVVPLEGESVRGEEVADGGGRAKQYAVGLSPRPTLVAPYCAHAYALRGNATRLR
jgi:hypothetical protein